MKTNYEEIHNLLIIKSSKIEEVKYQIIKNGVIKIKKQKIDLFCFITKTIISQQISDNVAQLIWNKFCSYFENDKPICIFNACNFDLFCVFSRVSIIKK